MISAYLFYINLVTFGPVTTEITRVVIVTFGTMGKYLRKYQTDLGPKFKVGRSVSADDTRISDFIFVVVHGTLLL